MKYKTCASTALTAKITASNCDVILGQANRLIFFDLPYAGTLGDAASILLQATMVSLITATDATKGILSQHQLYGPKINSTEAVRFGSNDNSTPKGRSYVVGSTVPTFEAMFTGLLASQYEQYEDLFGNMNKSKDLATVGVVFLTGDDQMVLGKDFKPIPVRSGFIGDPSGMDLHGLTQFPISFELKKGWWRDTQTVTLAYQHELL